MNAFVLRICWYAVMGLLLVGLGACGSGSHRGGVETLDEPDLRGNKAATGSVSGAAQKGPFVKGTRVLINRLSGTGENTYETATSAIKDDLGSFSFPTKGTGPILIEADGIHFNEITGTLSKDRLQLRAIYNVTHALEQRAHINILTHLAYKRILRLMLQGVAVETAIRQGEKDVIESLSAVVPIANTNAFSELTLYTNDTIDKRGDAYLLALSAILCQYTIDRHKTSPENTVDSQLGYVLNNLSDEIAEFGRIISTEIISDLIVAKHGLRPDSIIRNLQNRSFDVAKQKLPVANIDAFIDTDGDGVVNEKDGDDDNDGISDDQDAQPYDYSEAVILATPTNLLSLPSQADTVFTWVVSQNAVLLDIEVAEDEGFSVGLRTYSTEESTFAIRFDNAGKFFLRARPRNTQGAWGEWSETAKLIVGEFSKQIVNSADWNIDAAAWHVDYLISTHGNGYIVAGTVNELSGVKSGRIFKLDNFGNLLWDYRINDLVSISSRSLELSDSTIVLMGRRSNSTTIVALTEEGQRLWQIDGLTHFEWSRLSTNLVELDGKLFLVDLSADRGNQSTLRLLSIDPISGVVAAVPPSVSAGSPNAAYNSGPTGLLPRSSDTVSTIWDASFADWTWDLVHSLTRTSSGNLALGYSSCRYYDYKAKVFCTNSQLSEFDTNGRIHWTATGDPGWGGQFRLLSAPVQNDKLIFLVDWGSYKEARIFQSGQKVAIVAQPYFVIGRTPDWIETSRRGQLLGFSVFQNKLVLARVDPDTSYTELVGIPCVSLIGCEPLALASTPDGGLALLYSDGDKQILKKIADADKL